MILKILHLINNIEEYQKIQNHAEENMNQKLRSKKIDDIRNYLIEEVIRHNLLNKKHQKMCRVLNYIENSHNLISTITVCVFISSFASLVRTLTRAPSSRIGLTICVIMSGIKKTYSVNN